MPPPTRCGRRCCCGCCCAPPACQGSRVDDLQRDRSAIRSGAVSSGPSQSAAGQRPIEPGISTRGRRPSATAWADGGWWPLLVAAGHWPPFLYLRRRDSTPAKMVHGFHFCTQPPTSSRRAQISRPSCTSTIHLAFSRANHRLSWLGRKGQKLRLAWPKRTYMHASVRLQLLHHDLGHDNNIDRPQST